MRRSAAAQATVIGWLLVLPAQVESAGVFETLWKVYVPLARPVYIAYAPAACPANLAHGRPPQLGNALVRTTAEPTLDDARPFRALVIAAAQAADDVR